MKVLILLSFIFLLSAQVALAQIFVNRVNLADSTVGEYIEMSILRTFGICTALVAMTGQQERWAARNAKGEKFEFNWDVEVFNLFYKNGWYVVTAINSDTFLLRRRHD
jgi:hypothetical protein